MQRERCNSLMAGKRLESVSESWEIAVSRRVVEVKELQKCDAYFKQRRIPLSYGANNYHYGGMRKFTGGLLHVSHNGETMTFSQARITRKSNAKYIKNIGMFQLSMDSR